MSWNKEDRAFKILTNRRVTTSDKKYYEEFGDNTLDISFSEIKTQKTPFNNPTLGISQGIVKEYAMFTLTEDITVPNRMSYYAVDATDATRSLEDNRLRYWISSKDGGAYTLKLYDNNSNEITPTACDWFFDYVTGILTFNGTIPNYSKPYKVKGFRYIGSLGGKIGGGFGQKDLYDLDYFPNNAAAANNHVPVYNAATDRYELKPLPDNSASTFSVETKEFLLTQPTTTFTVDKTISGLVYVTVNGITQSEAVDYSINDKTLTFKVPLSTGKRVVIKYFFSLSGLAISSRVSSPNYTKLELSDTNRTLSLVAINPADSLSVEIMRIFNYKLRNSWDKAAVYKNGDYVFHNQSLYTSKVQGDNINKIPTDTTSWDCLISSSSDTSVIEYDYTQLNSNENIISLTKDQKLVILNYKSANNGIASINTISGLSAGNSVRIYAAAGTKIIFSDTANLITEGGLGTTLNGDNGDWIEFINRKGVYYQMSSATYKV